MPLSEFYRLARGICESAKQKEAAGATDLPIAPNNHLADLALGNDQISLQGHSARGWSSTSSYNEQFNNLRFQNSVLGNTSNSIERAEAFNDFPTPVSSVGVGNGDAMAPWLSYNLLTELPPVTLNDSISGATSIPSDMKLRSRKFQSLPFKSGSEIISICDSDTTKKALVFPSIRVQNQDSGIANSNSSFVNFSHFRRPSNHQSNVPCLNDMPTLGTLVRDPGGMTKDTSTTGKSILVPLKGSSKPAATMPLEGSRTAEKSEALHQENAVKGKRVIEPIVASTSVSSGNSVEGVSDNPTQNLKRKFREGDEHEGLSEDLEDEFAGTGKSAPTKGGAGSKRGRAAEVHNLSERRRRDRINEKMRALQELIPNCNKVDKASMLDEAIQYMKTLQLQLQIMSMGAGLYVPPMMLTPQMQVAHMRLFAPMGTGYGLGMNPIAHVPLGAYFPGPSLQPVAGLRTSQPMAGLNFSSLGHPSQGPPLVPCVNTSPVDINLNASTAASHFKTPSNENDLVQNNDSQLIGNADAGGSEKPKVIQ